MTENSNSPAVSNPELQPQSTSRHRRAATLLALVFFVCIGWIVLTRLHTADEPLERDICTQIMMGRVLADGGKMYVDTIEFKPPGMFVIWQIVHQLVGTSPLVVVWVNILVTIVTLIGVYLAGSAQSWGRVGGLYAMGFWTLISGDMMLQANQPSNEVFMNLFMIWGLALWLRGDAARARWAHFAAAGLLLGLGTLIKPALVVVVCMALAWVMAEGIGPVALRRRARAMTWVWLPIAAGWGLMVLYFACRGRADALYDCLVRYGMFYAKSGSQGTASIWMNILRGLSEELIPSYMVFLIPLMGLTALGIWGGLRGGQRSQTLTFAGCLFGTFLAVSIPGWFYPHYYQLYLPILAVGAGWGVVTVANSLRKPVAAQCLGIGTIIFLLWHTAPDYHYDGMTWSRLKYPGMGGMFIEMERCGQAVNRMLRPDEPFYVWGIDPGVYYYSDRKPASGIFWADRLLFGPTRAQVTQKVIADLEMTQPPLILTEDLETLLPSVDHPIYKWVNQNYDEAPAARFSKFFTVYLRRGSALASRLATNQQPFVLTLADVDPDFLRQVSDELLQKGQAHEAMEYLKKAMEIDPEHPEDYNNLAWLLATSSNADVRDGRHAMELAKHACQLTDFKQTMFVGTLAAAYAEAGQFDKAIATAQKACTLATESGDQDLLKRNQELLSYYLKSSPYHEPAKESVPAVP